MDYLFALTSTVVASDGGTVRIHEGEVWAADDPVVTANPGLFGPSPTKVRRTTAAPAWTPVEAATAVPGEKRRPTKRA